MPRACSVCSHKRRSEIDAAICDSFAKGGDSITSIAKDFQLTRDALYRHKREHLKPALATACVSKQTHTTGSGSTEEEPKSPARRYAGRLLDRVEYLWAESVAGLNDAKEHVVEVSKDGTVTTSKAGDLKARAQFISTARGVAELLGQATGELGQAHQAAPQSIAVNILLGLPRGGPVRPVPVESAVEVLAIEQGEGKPYSIYSSVIGRFRNISCILLNYPVYVAVASSPMRTF